MIKIFEKYWNEHKEAMYGILVGNNSKSLENLRLTFITLMIDIWKGLQLKKPYNIQVIRQAVTMPYTSYLLDDVSESYEFHILMALAFLYHTEECNTNIFATKEIDKNIYYAIVQGGFSTSTALSRIESVIDQYKIDLVPYLEFVIYAWDSMGENN